MISIRVAQKIPG